MRVWHLCPPTWVGWIMQLTMRFSLLIGTSRHALQPKCYFAS
jgi:hypothetical protein